MHFLLVYMAAFFSQPSFSAEDTKFLWDGEYRSRGLLQSNVLSAGDGRFDVFSHRLKLNAEFEPNDRLDAKISAILAQNWGDDIRGFSGLREDLDMENFRIFEAYGEWHLSSAFFLKFGRWALGFGEGALFSSNLDDDFPYSLDGVMLGYESTNFELRLGGLRVGDWPSGQGFTADPDSTAYFASINLKSWEPVFSFFQIYFYREQKDGFSDSVTGLSLPAEASNHFGFSTSGEYNKFSYSTDYVQYSGEFTDLGTNIDGYMTHIKLGVKPRENKDFKLYLVFHYDTGDKAATTDVNEFYQPLFYNHHKFAGVLDLLAWGNLTYFGIGAEWGIRQKSKLHVQALSFSRTSAADGPRNISFQGFGDTEDFINSDIASNSSNISNKDLGLEIDVVFTRKFDAGVHLEFLVGAFLVGDYFEAYGRENDILGTRLTLSLPF